MITTVMISNKLHIRDKVELHSFTTYTSTCKFNLSTSNAIGVNIKMHSLEQTSQFQLLNQKLYPPKRSQQPGFCKWSVLSNSQMVDQAQERHQIRDNRKKATSKAGAWENLPTLKILVNQKLGFCRQHPTNYCFGKTELFHIQVSIAKYFPFNNHLSRELCSSDSSLKHKLSSKPCELLCWLPTIN